LKKLFIYMKKLKRQKKVDAFYMYTSAEDEDGWVYFLKDALERHTETCGLYDDVFSRHTLQKIITEDEATKKDLLNVAIYNENDEDTKQIHSGKHSRDSETVRLLMFDDKPWHSHINARLGTVVGVVPYVDFPDFKDIIALVEANPGLVNFINWWYQDPYGRDENETAAWNRFRKELKQEYDKASRGTGRYDMSEDREVDRTINAIRALYDNDVPEGLNRDRRHSIPSFQLSELPAAASIKSYKGTKPYKGTEYERALRHHQQQPSIKKVMKRREQTRRRKQQEKKEKLFEEKVDLRKDAAKTALDQAQNKDASPNCRGVITVDQVQQECNATFAKGFLGCGRISRHECGFCGKAICKGCCQKLSVEAKTEKACNACYQKYRVDDEFLEHLRREVFGRRRLYANTVSPVSGKRYKDSPVMLRLLQEIWDAQPDKP